MKMLVLTLALMSFASLSASANVDYRAYQSPVRNQLSRGTCTAFAVVGAMEALPGMPTQLSVQYLYAIMKKTELARNVDAVIKTHRIPQHFVNEGDHLVNYVQVLQAFGIPPEQWLPYDGSDPRTFAWCNKPGHGIKDQALNEYLCQARVDDTRMLIATDYGKYHIGADTEIITGAAARDPETFKRALDGRNQAFFVRSIPVSYWVVPSQIFDKSLHGNLDLDNHVQVEVRTPWNVWVRMSFARFLTSGFNVWGPSIDAMLDSDRFRTVPFTAHDDWAGHAVEIVGYDDTGFLIKNSWGTGWGNQGYGHISYAYHRAMVKEALIIHSVWTKAPSKDPSSVYFAGYRLKSYYDSATSALSLSTYTIGVKDPLLASVTYTITPVNIAGQATGPSMSFTSAPGLNLNFWKQGYGMYITNITPALGRLRVDVTYSADALNRRTKAYFVNVMTTGMRDYAPIN